MAPTARLLIVCGGGALNDHLLGRLRALLPGVEVVSLRRARPAAPAGRGGGLRLAGARHRPARGRQPGQRDRRTRRTRCWARSTPPDSPSALAGNLRLRGLHRPHFRRQMPEDQRRSQRDQPHAREGGLEGMQRVPAGVALPNMPV